MVDLAENQLHIILVNAVIEKDGKYLIAQRSFEESQMPGYWSLPGGKADRTDGGVQNILEKTLMREIAEEVGLEVEAKPLLIYQTTFIRSTGHHVIEFCFLCHWQSGEARALEDSIAVAWVAPDQLGNFEISDQMKERIILADNLLHQPS